MLCTLIAFAVHKVSVCEPLQSEQEQERQHSHIVADDSFLTSVCAEQSDQKLVGEYCDKSNAPLETVSFHRKLSL